MEINFLFKLVLLDFHFPVISLQMNQIESLGAISFILPSAYTPLSYFYLH